MREAPGGSAARSEEAQTALADEQALVIADPDHSADEDRFILLGVSASRVLVANREERKAYTERWTR